MEANNTPVGTAPIVSMEQLAQLVYDWHLVGLTQLHQLVEIPEDLVMEIDFSTDGSKPEQLLFVGDLNKGFRAGIIAAMSIFEKLPFNVQVAETEVTHDAPVTPQ